MVNHAFLGYAPVPLTVEECNELARTFGIRDLRLFKREFCLVLEGEVCCYEFKQAAGLAVERRVNKPVTNCLRVLPRDPQED